MIPPCLRVLAAAALTFAAWCGTGAAQTPAPDPRDPAAPSQAPAQAPATTGAAPVDAEALGSGTPRRDQGGGETRTGADTTADQPTPPAGSANPPGGPVHPGPNPALGRGS